MSYLVLARKWRPQTFDDLVGQEAIGRMLRSALEHNKVAHAYIFSGPRGVGKTSTARILAKALNCEQGPTATPCNACASCRAITDGSSLDVTEIDGASNTGVDNVRDLRERVRYAASGGRYKIYIIDEAHMLSTAAFNALLKTLEEPPAHVIFVLATTEPKRIPATVLSRCQHLPFRRIGSQRIKERLAAIVGEEGINASDTALDMVARVADGSMRDALTILDQVGSISDDINLADLRDLLAITDTETLTRVTSAVIEGDAQAVVTMIADLTNAGTDLRAFAKDLLQYVRNLLIVKIVGGGAGALELSDEEAGALARLSEKTSQEHLSLILAELVRSEPVFRSAFHPRIALEMTLIRLALLSHFSSVGDAIRMLKGTPSPHPMSVGDAPEKRTRVKTVSPPTAAEPQPAPPSSAPSRETKGMALKDVWDEVLTRLEEMNRPLAYKLKEGTCTFGESEVRIVFNGGLAVHAESVTENLAVVKNVLKETAGRDIGLSLETSKGKAPTKRELKEKALSDPIVKEALELFEGRIVDVIPQPKGGDNV
ncbi:MAG: DNA polymerase III subunit gamma/tau [Chloroflexota bacterium]